MEMCFGKLSEEEFKNRLERLRLFWFSLAGLIGSEKPTIGGDLDIDETMYCTNSSEPGRLLIIQQRGVAKKE